MSSEHEPDRPQRHHPLDERLFIAGAVMVAITIAVIAAMTLAAFLRISAPAPLAVAIRAGLVGLLAAQVTGVWMLGHGLALLETTPTRCSSR